MRKHQTKPSVKSAVAVVAALGSFGLAASSAATLPSKLILHVGTGIGPAKLGQTPRQVRSELGKPNSVYRAGETLYTYNPGRYFLDVSFTKPSTAHPGGTVFVIATRRLGTKTAAGVGIGSSFARVRRAYPHASCAFSQKLRSEGAAGCTVMTKWNGHKVETDFQGGSRVGFVAVRDLSYRPPR